MPGVCATPGCGRDLPPRKGRARPRKYCLTCRPSQVTPPAADSAEEGRPGVVVSPPDFHKVPLVESYRKQLEDAEVLETPNGALVIHLATLLASGDASATGVAALSRELRTAMDVALRGAAKQGDSIDELTARRRSKAALA